MCLQEKEWASSVEGKGYKFEKVNNKASICLHVTINVNYDFCVCTTFFKESSYIQGGVFFLSKYDSNCIIYDI